MSKTRNERQIRGGFIIVRRADANGALRRIARQPFEHGSLEEAQQQAAALAARERAEFTVFEAVSTALPAPKPDEAPSLPEAGVAAACTQQEEPADTDPAGAPPVVALAPQRPVVVERRTRRAAQARSAQQGGKR